MQDFAKMELQEIQDNIRSRRNKIFLHMEEVSFNVTYIDQKEKEKEKINCLKKNDNDSCLALLYLTLYFLVLR